MVPEPGTQVPVLNANNNTTNNTTKNSAATTKLNRNYSDNNGLKFSRLCLVLQNFRSAGT